MMDDMTVGDLGYDLQRLLDRQRPMALHVFRNTDGKYEVWASDAPFVVKTKRKGVRFVRLVSTRPEVALANIADKVFRTGAFQEITEI